jgi:hypothetical protein
MQRAIGSCPKFLKDKKDGKVPSTSGIFVIDINFASSNSDWVLDTGSCAHICGNMQTLRNRRKLEKVKCNYGLVMVQVLQPSP